MTTTDDRFVPWPRAVAERYVETGFWQGRALGDAVFAVADAVPEAVALVHGGRRVSYLDLAGRVDAAAVRLAGLGLRPGDRIVLQLPNTVEFAVLTLACLRLGVAPVMAYPGHRGHEMAYLAEHAEAVALVVPAVLKGFDHQAMAAEIMRGSATVRHLLVLGELSAAGAVDVRALCAPPEGPAPRSTMDAFRPDSRSVALFLLSGGTTGLPKLIARTHDDFLYNARCSAEVCGLGTDAVYYAALPFSHSFPLACPGMLGTLLCGGRVVMGSAGPEEAYELIEREGVTITAVVPGVAQRWLDHRRTDPGRALGSLRVLQVGGAHLAEKVARSILPTLGCTLQQVFGMAEGLVCCTRLDDPEEVICSTQGRPISPGDEIVVVDETGAELPDDVPGVLLTRGPYTPRGYYRAAEHNARVFTADGWYRTGDIVRRRPDGNLVVEGRDKDMINRGGVNISAEEIENFAYQVPGVRQAAAVAMPDTHLGECVCLFVAADDGHQVTLGKVHAVMTDSGAARYKFPERLVVLDSLATTTIGKIDKRALHADITHRLAAERRADDQGHGRPASDAVPGIHGGRSMRFRLLGGVEVVAGGEVVEAGPAKQRCVLAALLWTPGAVVPVETLIDRVWGDRPPPQARNSLYSYVTRLRALTNGDGLGRPLSRDSLGYRLDVDPERVDLADYQRLVRQGRATSSAVERLAAFDQALELWRGEPLAGVPGEWAQRARGRLDLQHIGVLVEWARTAIDAGRSEAVVDRLAQARNRYPYAESMIEQLVIALCRTGRVERALGTLREFRERFVEELGVEPDRTLRDLEVRALRADPDLLGARADEEGRRNARAMPIRYANNSQVNLAYQVIGDQRCGRPDIVFVPGLLSHLDLWWEDPPAADFFHRLATHSRLIMFDKRDTGLSDRTTGDASLRERAGDIRAVMEAAGSSRAVLFAYSEGVPMSIVCAVEHPERIAGLVLAGGAARWSPAEDYPCGDHFEQMVATLEATARGSWGQGDTIEWYCQHLAHCQHARDAVGRRERMSVSPNDFIRMLQMIRGIDVRDALTSVKAPTVLLQRREDRVSPPFYGRYLAGRIPGARYVEQPGDHIIWLGQTDQVISEVARLVTSSK